MIIGEYKGNKIDYDSRERKFTAIVTDLGLTADTQAELEKKIDEAIKRSGCFPIGVFYISGRAIRHGRITSYNPGDKRGYFVSDDGRREKPWRLKEFFSDTESNRDIANENQSRIDAIESVEKEISELHKGLEKSFPDHYEEITKRSAGQ